MRTEEMIVGCATLLLRLLLSITRRYTRGKNVIYHETQV